MKFSIFLDLFFIFFTYFLIVLKIVFAVLTIFLEFVLQNKILFQDTLFLILNQNQSHLQFLDIFFQKVKLFSTFLSSKINTPINYIFLKQCNVCLFFFDDFLYCLCLYISVFSRTQCVYVLSAFFMLPNFDFRGLKLINQKSDSFVDLR